MRRLVLLAAALLAAGCGSAEEQAGPAVTTTSSAPLPATTEATPPPAPSEPTPPPAGTTWISVYFLRDGRIAAAHRDVPATRALARAALEALAAGPSEEERRAGLTTSVPRKLEIERLIVGDGAARVDFAGEECPSIAQIVYTLTQFPSVRRVTGNCIPRSAYAGGLTRAALGDLTPPILVEAPTLGEEARSPLRITGSANTFEATFVVTVVDADGSVVAEQVVTATSGSGDRGTFDVSVPFDVDRPGEGALLAYERSAEDGSQLHLVEIPLRLIP
jgi:germination protein M